MMTEQEKDALIAEDVRKSKIALVELEKGAQKFLDMDGVNALPANEFVVLLEQLNAAAMMLLTKNVTIVAAYLGDKSVFDTHLEGLKGMFEEQSAVLDDIRKKFLDALTASEKVLH